MEQKALLDAARANRVILSRRKLRSNLRATHHGTGRGRFAAFRARALGSEEGTVTFHAAEPLGGAPAKHITPVRDHFAFAR